LLFVRILNISRDRGRKQKIEKEKRVGREAEKEDKILNF